MKRRDLIKGGLLAGLAGVTGLGRGGLSATAGGAAGNGGPGRREPVRNIIFFAYDGFNYEDLALARYFGAMQGRGPLELERLLGVAATGSMLTHSLTSVVTDSSAASSAWAVGRKVVNGAVSMYPDGRELTPILELARQAGKATGLITTTRVTHATPACWVARVPERAMEDEIARQYLHFQPEVVLGGGREHFTAEGRDDGRDLEGAFAAAGYRVVRSAAELTAATVAGSAPRTSRLFGVFHDDHLPFEIDRLYQDAGGPSLAEMARVGLQVLRQHDGGFVVQIEAGRIDHANHHNDPGGSVWDILAADEALAEVRAFVDREPGTLLIMASDHATGGQAVYGTGPRYNLSTEALETLGRARISGERLRRRVLGRNPTAEQVRREVRERLGIHLTGPQADDVVRVMARRLRTAHPNAHTVEPANSLYRILSSVAAGEDDLLDRPNVNYATGAHTAGLVPLLAYGAWDGPRALGIVDNTDLFAWMTGALGIDFRNPEMTEAEARRLGAVADPAAMTVM
jgi:alkaline phosphatase